MKRGWLLLLVLSLGLNAGLLWRALAGREGPPELPPPRADERAEGRAEGRPEWTRRAERRLDLLADRLELDETARERFLAVRRESLPVLIALREQVAGARGDLREAFRAVPLDTGRIRAGLGRLAATQGRVDSLVSSTMLRELELLTPQQREAYLDAMPWEPGPHGGPGRGPGRGSRPGRDR